VQQQHKCRFDRFEDRVNRPLPCVLLALLFLSGPISARDRTQIETAVEETTEILEKTKMGRKTGSWVWMPIPIANPTLEVGLAMTAMRLYQIGENAPASTTAVGAFATTNESWGGGIFTRNHLENDRIRISGGLGYADLNLDFYGVGNDPGESGLKVQINQRGSFAFAQSLWKVRENVYAGPRFRYLSLTTRFPILDDIFPQHDLKLVSSGVGAKLEWDTRDNTFSPTRGHFFEVALDTSSEAFGGDLNYGQLNVKWAKFFPFKEKDVLAIQATGCYASDGAPFYDICLIGSGRNLRGYTGGRFRDQTMLTTQVEYRKHVRGRWGVAVFAGIGQVAETFGDFSTDNIRPSVGVGVRWVASEAHGLRLSMDYARGEDDSAFYFYIGESF
jgi:outer membrane protein assembly factor BamA